MSVQSDRRAGGSPGGVSFSFSYKELIATGLSGALLAFLASTWHDVVRVAEEIGAGLIVAGSRGLGGVRRALMGSVSDSVVRHAQASLGSDFSNVPATPTCDLLQTLPRKSAG